MCSTMVGGGWRLAVGGGWRLAVGNWRLVAVGGGWWLVIGGWWRLAVVGSRRWRLAAVGGWRLVVGGWWRLAVDGSWRLAVGGPLGRSLRAVLSKKKKIWSLKDRPGCGTRAAGPQWRSRRLPPPGRSSEVGHSPPGSAKPYQEDPGGSTQLITAVPGSRPATGGNHPQHRCTPPLCDIPSGCCSFTGPWTVTRSSLRMLRQVAAFCRPLRPVLLLVSFPRSRSPVVGVLGLC